MNIRARIADYTQSEPAGAMWKAIRSVKPLRSISVDITRRCNLRCKGCYFFTEQMDGNGEANEQQFDAFIAQQVARGTTFVTVLGGEPSLVPNRLRKLAAKFNTMIVTNGLKRIPYDGLEDCSIAVSVWGDLATDKKLRGYGKLNIFEKALANYSNDPRVIWYLTLPTTPDPRTEDVVEACILNGNLLGFNFYGDLELVGGSLDHRRGFAEARAFVYRMLALYPANIVFNAYLNEVITTGTMKDTHWGFDVCASVSVDHPTNRSRLENGNAFNPHFNAYGPDLAQPRRCCVGEARDCATCYDVWAHISWIALALDKHLSSESEFFDWLSTMYLFYGVSRLIDYGDFRARLPEIHAKQGNRSML